jgi:uncharacterized repeat protein (TIGR01451 family)
MNANPGDLITYTITLNNPGEGLNNASMTDPLAPELTFAGNLWASSGSASYANGKVNWSGAVSSDVDVVIRFDATLNAGIISPTLVNNTATIFDGNGHSWQRQAHVYVLSLPNFLPMVEH